MNQPPNKCQVYLNLGSPLSAISASHDQNKLIVAGRDIVKIVSLQNNEFKITSNLRAGKTQSLNYTGNDCCWHPSNVENYKSLVATAATNGAVVIWNLVRDGSKSVERVFSDHSRAVNKLAWHPDKLDCLLTGSQDNTLRFWDIRETANASKITFSPKSESIRDVQFNPYQSNQFAAAFDNGTIQLWDIRKPTMPVEKITSHQGLVLTIDWHPEERNIIASGGRDRAIRVWDFSTGRSLNNVSTISSVSRIKWRPGNKWHIASCSSIVDFNIHVWDVKKPYIPLFSFTDHRDVPTGLIWRSSSTLISCSKDSNLLLNEYNDAYKPYKHIRTTGISWNANNEIASINDKINRNQNNDNSNLLQQQQQTYPAPMHASFFASFNVPTPPPLPPLVKVEQGIMNVFTPKYPNIDSINDEKYVFEYYAKNYKFRGDSFINLCQHNQLVSLNVKQYHISKIWSLLQLYFSHLDQLKPKDERESEEQILQQQQQLKLQQQQKENSKKEKQQQQQQKEKDISNNIDKEEDKDKENQDDQVKNSKEENGKEIEKIKNSKESDTIKSNEFENDEDYNNSTNKDSIGLDSIKFGSFNQLNGGDVFDPSNDMMTAKEDVPSLEFQADSSSNNDQFFNSLLSAEAVTPLVSLPIRAPSIDNQKSTENILDKNNESNRRQKEELGKKDNSKKNNSGSNNNKKEDKNEKKDNSNNSNSNSLDNDGKNNNNNNNNNGKDNNNSSNGKEEKKNGEDLKILIPCFEFEEFDFQPILVDMLDCCIERGDVQTCVFIVLILNRYIDLNIDKNQLTRWFGSYIDLLQRFKFWSLALEVMKYCDDQTINQASKRHTTFISACSQCGKSIPQNSLICEKCSRISSKCSICRLPVKGVYVWCQGCGHGGHLDHMKSWFIDNKQKSCPTGCTHICGISTLLNK